MNLYTMKDEGLLYCFFRDGQHFNPAFITSSNDGETWENYTHFITHDIGGRQCPYARYAQIDENTVGISFTDGHPRQYGNSLYYTEFRNGAFYNVDGTKIKDLSAGPTDDVSSIDWKQLTFDSEFKNIRPIVVAGDGYKVLMWLGDHKWSHYQNYATDAIGIILERP